ncbi:hypothetical protein MSG28_006606 [Choristoneura fumiferana]|uniref:Uncharacterized protein n=1 Tax=Choristoneura fumiferana TaxID=7141 RepID=A0ACC0JFM2_CHOFU|nr:hypothetical protein MSG28_006606 [Choristoneura fumiferana]
MISGKMDETVLLLRKWSISEEIIKNFLDNDISIENFKDLTDTYLKELCPHIGQRIILRNNIQDLLESVATTEALSENTVYTNHESHSSARTNKEVSGDSFSSLPILDDITNILEDINRPLFRILTSTHCCKHLPMEAAFLIIIKDINVSMLRNAIYL